MITAKTTNIRREQTRIIFFVAFSDWSEKAFIINSEWLSVDEIKAKVLQEISDRKEILQQAEDKKLELETFIDMEI